MYEFKGLKEYKCFEYADFVKFYRNTELWRPNNVIMNDELARKEINLYETCTKLWNDLITKEKYHFERDGFLILEYTREAKRVRYRRKKDLKGRPKKEQEDIKSVNISFRLTEKQMEKLKYNADKRKMTPIEFLVSYINNLRIYD